MYHRFIRSTTGQASLKSFYKFINQRRFVYFCKIDNTPYQAFVKSGKTIEQREKELTSGTTGFKPMMDTTIENSSSSFTSCGSSGSAPRSAASLMRVGPVAVPEAVAWLDDLTMELNATTAGGKTEYQLTMKYAPSKPKLASCATWTISHRFDEYRDLRKRLLKRMQHGHSCGAECKWLFKVIKQYFPQKSLFGNNCPKVVAIRQQTLIRCLTTVQASLVNRGNQGCRVLVHDVAAEFNRFVVRDKKDVEVRSMVVDSPSSELSVVTRDSLDSLDFDTVDDSELEDEDEEEKECDACHRRHVVCRTHSKLKA